MTFNEYQKSARLTAIYPERFKIIYSALGLAGETGEVAGKIGKWIRDNDAGKLTKEQLIQLKRECGDVLWYIANLCSDLEFNLNEVAIENIEKLFDRKDRDVLKGSGDNR